MNNKLIFGFDVGTNSVGWAAVQLAFEEANGKILGLGSRIIPMDQAEIGDFNKGNLQSAASQRTHHRGVRRLRERQLKRRERLVKVLKIMNFIPSEWEPNPRYSFAFIDEGERTRFKFQESYNEMKGLFLKKHPHMKSVSHDWVIYYLRKKALNNKITKEELAWLILQANVKRGYFQLRGDSELETEANKYFVSSIVDKIEDLEDDVRGKKRLNIYLRDDVIGGYESKEIPDWIGKEVEFIVTEKETKEGKKITLSTPDPKDWTLRKKKTEQIIAKADKTVGAYIFDKLLENPNAKIRGKEVHTIDRHFFKEELESILKVQANFHVELKDASLLGLATKALYDKNKAHRTNLMKFDMTHLLLNDILYYQRPLKTKKHLIANCKYENYQYKGKEGNVMFKPVKGIAKSHSLFQEFRIWDIIHNIKVIQISDQDENGIIRNDIDVSDEILTHTIKANLFDAFDRAKELSHNQILKAIGLNNKEYKLNYEVGSKLKGNELKAAVLKLGKGHEDVSNEIDNLLADGLRLELLWHAVYSLGDNIEHLRSGLKNKKLELSSELQNLLIDLPSFSKDYAAFSKKALKKLLPLMKCGKYWDVNTISDQVKERINTLLDAIDSEAVSDRSRDNLIGMEDISDFQGLNLTKASYAVYDRHSESINIEKYSSPEDIDVSKLVPNHSLRNPTAEKVLRETLLVAKDMWAKYGKPDEIHVEMARELKLPNDKRKEYTYKRNENYIRNQRAKAMLVELSKENSDINPFSKGHLDTFKIFEEGAVQNEKLIDKDIIAIRKKGDPSKSEVTRYKLWLEQKYISPYTGQIIPLSKLFTPAYEIEHIIPKTLFYDDSFNNKVICETKANRFKDNRTAYEMICNAGGTEVDSGIILLTKDVYEAQMKSMYASINYKKYKNLLQYDPPKGFSARQLNNTRYINRKLLQLLDPIVREDNEIEAISKNMLSMQGGVTSDLKNDWGLHDVWKRLLAPRFIRMNKISGSNDYYNKKGNRIDLSGYENELKRLDHRHHALDALVIACTTRAHVNYKNSLKSEKRRYDLEPKLLKPREKNNKKSYVLPWESIAQDAFDALEKVIVSIKNNNRVINKTINYYQKYIEQADGSWKKGYVKQATNNDHWAVRKPLHQETIYGRLTQVEYKDVSVSSAWGNVELIANSEIKSQLRKVHATYKGDYKKAKKYLKHSPLQLDGKEVNRITMRLENPNYATSQLTIDSTVKRKQLDKIVDQKLKAEIISHLEQYNDISEDAFSETGMVEFNKGRHKPVKSVKVKQDLGIAFPLGYSESTKHKYAKGAKGTNLYFVIYKNIETGEHEITSSSTLPFNDLIELEKAGEELSEYREGYEYFTLSPGDLVYVNDMDDKTLSVKEYKPSRIYKCVSFSKHQCFFVPHRISSVIVDKKEFSVKNKSERSIDEIMIKNSCIKLKIDRLGTLL